MTGDRKKEERNKGTRKQGLREKDGQKNTEVKIQEIRIGEIPSQNTHQTEASLMKEIVTVGLGMTATKKCIWIGKISMVIQKRREEREEILFRNMRITDSKIRTVKIPEEEIDQSRGKRIENMQALKVTKMGTRMVLRDDGKNPADTLNIPESQRKIRTVEERSNSTK